jgi:hypothetical protein
MGLIVVIATLGAKAITEIICTVINLPLFRGTLKESVIHRFFGVTAIALV